MTKIHVRPFRTTESDGDLLVTDSASRSMLSLLQASPQHGRTTLSFRHYDRRFAAIGTLDLAELEGRLSGTVCLTFRDGLLTDYYVA